MESRIRTTRRALRLSSLLALALAAACAHGEQQPADRPTVDEERVSLGYTTESRSNSTASVATMRERDIRERRAVRFEELLERLPGVDVKRVGSDYSVNIRGVRTFMGSTQPLYVVDGRVVSSTDVISPQTVVRIDVLKDAASLATYGSRGANGVIVVTTIHTH